jgi:short-subunit dehydrogenase
VIGANGVIGREISQLANRAGDFVIGVDKSFTGYSHCCNRFITGDLYDDDTIEKILYLLPQTSKLNRNFFLAHGMHEYGDSCNLDVQLIENIFRTNTFSVMKLVLACLPQLKKGDKVFVLDSIVTIHPLPYSMAYSASKSACNSFVRSLAPTLAEQGIELAVIITGNVNTGFNETNVRYCELHMLDSNHKSQRLLRFINSQAGVPPVSVAKFIINLSRHKINRFETQFVYGANARLTHIIYRLLGSRISAKLLNFWITK